MFICTRCLSTLAYRTFLFLHVNSRYTESWKYDVDDDKYLQNNLYSFTATFNIIFRLILMWCYSFVLLLFCAPFLSFLVSLSMCMFFLWINHRHFHSILEHINIITAQQQFRKKSRLSFCSLQFIQFYSTISHCFVILHTFLFFKQVLVMVASPIEKDKGDEVK